eukprot:PhF_6_TR24793/c0_g1_i2/m.34096
MSYSSNNASGQQGAGGPPTPNTASLIPPAITVSILPSLGNNSNNNSNAAAGAPPTPTTSTSPAPPPPPGTTQFQPPIRNRSGSFDLQLHHDFNPMMSNSTFSDLTLEIHNHDGTVENVPCHRVILAGASSHFATMLSSNFEEGRTQRIVIEPDEAESFKMFLSSVYGKLSLSEGDHTNIQKVAWLYDKYAVSSGVTTISESMKENTIMATYLAQVPAFSPLAMELLCTQFLMIFFTPSEEVNTAAVRLLHYDTLNRLVQSDAVVLKTESQMLRLVLAWLDIKLEGHNPSNLLPSGGSVGGGGGSLGTGGDGSEPAATTSRPASSGGDAQGQQQPPPPSIPHCTSSLSPEDHHTDTEDIVEQVGILLGGIRTEMLSLADLEFMGSLPYLQYPTISEILKEKLIAGYRHKAHIAEGKFRVFRSRQHILYDRTFAPWEKLFFGDCPETDLAGVKFCVSFDYRESKFGAFLKFQHKFDISIPIRFTVHLPNTNKCCERRFRPMFDFRWGWRCIDNDLLFEHRASQIRLYCVVAFSDKQNAPDAVA